LKRLTLTLIPLAALLAASAALASAGPPTRATVLIRHQTQHCHTWSFDNGKFVAAASGTIAKGGTITFTNNDVMPHKLLLKSGPAPVFQGSPLLNHMGATVTVAFPKAGVYLFGTKPGEDYMKGVVTTGADNVLTLKVTVK
jgi:plastocyanin